MKKTYEQVIENVSSLKVEEYFNSCMGGSIIYSKPSIDEYSLEIISFIYGLKKNKIEKDCNKLLKKKYNNLEKNWDLALEGKLKF